MGNVTRTDPRSGERGAISIKALLGLIFAVVGAFLLIKITPVYINEREVLYKVDELANKSAVRNTKEEDIKKAIERIRKDHELPENSINLVSSETGKVQISISYTIPIDFLVTTYDWKVVDSRVGKATISS